MEPKWLGWAQKLAALSQSGLAFSENPFEIERYEAIRQIAAEMMAAQSDAEPAKVRDLFAGEWGYATPKIDVRGVVFRDGKILLVREKRDGAFTLPGGFADVGDSPSGAVVREVREESGFLTRAVKLLAVWDRQRQRQVPLLPFHIYKLAFRCEIEGGEPRESFETGDPRFYGEDEIPPLSQGRTSPKQIARLFEHLRNPDWPADFD
jgi:ADP-ribose pyrophosphatase YjhB (NUDIX family)